MLSFLVDENQSRLFQLNRQTRSFHNQRQRIEASWKIACRLDPKFKIPEEAGSLRQCYQGNREPTFWYLCYALKMRFLRTTMKRLFNRYPKLNPNVIVHLLASDQNNVKINETPFWYTPRPDLCELKDGDMMNGKESWILEVLYMGSSIVLRTALQVLAKRMYRYPASDFTAISKWIVYMISASEDVGLIHLFFEFGLIPRMDSKHCGNLLSVTDGDQPLFQTLIDQRFVQLQLNKTNINLSWLLQSIKNGASRLVLPWLTKSFILNQESKLYSQFLFDWLFTETGLRYCDESNIDSILQIMLHILSSDVDSNHFRGKKETLSQIRRSIHLNIRDPKIATRFYLMLKLLS